MEVRRVGIFHVFMSFFFVFVCFFPITFFCSGRFGLVIGKGRTWCFHDLLVKG